jgi:hypothetical protein
LASGFFGSSPDYVHSVVPAQVLDGLDEELAAALAGVEQRHRGVRPQVG